MKPAPFDLRRVLLATAALAGSLACAPQVQAQGLIPEMLQLPAAPRAGEGGLTLFPLRNGLYMMSGPGGANMLVSTGFEGVAIVDPQGGPSTAALLTEIRKITDRPIQMVLNTNGDADHIAGNKAVAAQGLDLNGGPGARPSVVDGGGQAKIWARQEVLNRLTAANADPAGVPTDIYFVARKDMFFNRDGVEMLHVPAGHTDGDSLIWFRRSDVLAVGDIYTPDAYPVIDLAGGGSINGLIDGLNTILRIAIPEFNTEGGTLVVPGHGRLSDEGDVSDYRDMVTIVRDRIKDMIGKKMTLAQVKAARPTLDYDVRYGADKGQVFIEQVYRSLSQPQRPATAAEGAR